MESNTLIGIGILLIIVLGFLFVSNMTGDVITGSVTTENVVDNEYFKISPVNKTNEDELNKTQNSTEPRVPYK